jgi:hypothetical protein
MPLCCHCHNPVAAPDVYYSRLFGYFHTRCWWKFNG